MLAGIALALAVAAFGNGAGAAPAQTQAGKLPSRAAPGGLRSLDGTEGGRLLVGTLAKTASTDAVFRVGLKTIRGGYFDAPPNVVGVVRSTDQSVTIAPFTTLLQKTPINGILYTIFDPKGGSRIGILFDDAQRFPRTFKPLMARFAALNPASQAPSPLKQVVAPDGVEAVMIPGNWQIQTLQGGVLVVNGPDQAAVVIRLLTYFTDPRFPEGPGAPPMPFTADPAAALAAVGQALAARNHKPPLKYHIERTVQEPKPPGTVTSAWLYGTVSQGGETRRFETLVQVAPVNAQGRWIVQINQKSAPAAVFQHDLPLLTTIYNSYRYDARRMSAVILTNARKRAEENNAIFKDSMRRAAAIQGNIDRSTAAFADYIGDRAIVTNGSVAGRFNASTARAIVEADPQRFHILSLNEYK